jgi:hypothetical protein
MLISGGTESSEVQLGIRLADVFSSEQWLEMNSVSGHSNSSAAVLINGRVLDSYPLLGNDCKFTDDSKPLLRIFGANLLQRLQAQIRHAMGQGRVQGTRMPPIWRYFIASKLDGGGKMHQDPHGEHFWNAQVIGRKIWTIIRPEEVMRLKDLPGEVGQAVHRWFDGTQPTARSWYGVEHNNTGILRAHAREGQWWQVVMEPGDLLYSPGFYHIVLALEPALGCSEQLVGATNIGKYIREVMQRIENDLESQLLFCSAWLDLYEGGPAAGGRVEKEGGPAAGPSGAWKWKGGEGEDIYQGGRGGELAQHKAVKWALSYCRKKMRRLQHVAKSAARRRQRG